MRRLLLLLLVIPLLSHAQVDVESIRSIEKAGFSVTIPLSLELRRGNDETMSFTANPRIDYFSGNFHTFLASTFSREEASGNRVVDEGYAHLRMVYSMSRYLTPEAFAQIEYQESIDLCQRRLFGVSDRFTMYRSDSIRLYVGVGVMLEGEDYALGTVDLLRSTNYISFRYLGDSFSFGLNMYYQPAFEDLQNFRVFSTTTLSFKLSSYVSYRTSIQSRYDNRPLTGGVDKLDVHILNGFVFEIN